VLSTFINPVPSDALDFTLSVSSSRDDLSGPGTDVPLVTPDALPPFLRAARRLARQIVGAGAGVGFDDAKRVFLGDEMREQPAKHRVLDDIGEISGMKGVVIVHQPPRTGGIATRGLRQARRSVSGQA